MLSKNESKAEELIKQMNDYFIKEEKNKQMKYYSRIEEKKELINDLTMLFKSKKYEMDLKIIIYFFESLNLIRKMIIGLKKILIKIYQKWI